MTPLRGRPSPPPSHPDPKTRHARYAMISPTRIPSCPSVAASSFRLGLVVMITVLMALSELLPHWLGRWLGKGGGWQSLGWWRHWLTRGRYRLCQRYYRVPSDGLSDLGHN